MPAQKPDSDLLVGSAAIRAYLTQLGMPERTDPYYLRRSGRWPIGRTTEDRGSGGKLIASKRWLRRYVDDLTKGPPLGRNRIVSKLRLGRQTIAAAPPKRRQKQASKPAAAPKRRGRIERELHPEWRRGRTRGSGAARRRIRQKRKVPYPISPVSASPPATERGLPI